MYFHSQRFEWRQVTVVNNQGLDLAGLWYSGSKSDQTIIIICHGFSGSKEGQGKALQMVEFLATAGLDGFLFDFAGCGQSQGQFPEITLTGQIEDLNCVINWATNKGYSKIVTMGRSFGGTTVICQAAQDKRVNAVCSWAAPVDLLGLFNQFRQEDSDYSDESTLVGDQGRVKVKKNFWLDISDYNVRQAASKLAPRPFLIVHGQEDEVVSVRDARRLFQEASQPKRLEILPWVDHRFVGSYRYVWEICLEWLRKWCL